MEILLFWDNRGYYLYRGLGRGYLGLFVLFFLLLLLLLLLLVLCRFGQDADRVVRGDA